MVQILVQILQNVIMNTATANLLFDKRVTKKNGKCPVKLTVYYLVQKRRYDINFEYTKEEWEKIKQPKLRDDLLKQSKGLLFSVLERANKTIESMEEFSFTEFEELFFSKKNDVKDIFSMLQQYIDSLNIEGRINTAMTYRSTKVAFEEFTGKKRLLFSEVTPNLLKSFEKKWLSDNKSITTVGIYMRSLRTIFNIAKSRNVITEKYYPFSKHKYQIPASVNVKKAISKEDIKKIYQYKAQRLSAEHFAKDIWVFSYLCNGINLRDIARLKYEDIKGDSIFFLRQKTIQTSRANQKQISAVIIPEIKKIIKTWGNKPERPDQYIFPILKPGMSIVQEVERVRQTIKTTNKYLRRIAETLKLGIDITTYSARHSFATQLKSSGASTEFISESLGHSSLAVTENYLASFSQEEKKKWASKLTEF